MTGYRISEAARASGFSVSALRFYEQVGMVVPERTATGYRSYREDDLESLQFVARGNQLGLSLGEITELLDLLDDEGVDRSRHGSATSSKSGSHKLKTASPSWSASPPNSRRRRPGSGPTHPTAPATIDVAVVPTRARRARLQSDI